MLLISTTILKLVPMERNQNKGPPLIKTQADVSDLVYQQQK